ncbi:MAG: orotidine-5'-phosphate decarboxylase [Actinomycetota bacterium]|nr:orotidine-5'-phosphate decarboxylase [Actinomycetota bacterium]MDD5666028.1 orotidine-5'-phosphate decarboxylase [Actinomycetota bacterium]
MSGARDPFIVALDLRKRESLLDLADRLRGEVETVKVGLEAFVRMGPGIVEELRGMGFKVFTDLKLHDIPNTVSGAVRGLVRTGASMLTVHASGGGAMLEAAVSAAREEAAAENVAAPLVLGVTVLTSLDDAAVAEIGWPQGAAGTALALARLAWEAGLDGVVASAREAPLLREALGGGAVIVTPGIRAAGAAVQDQARTSTPREALAAGADYLVVGRPVIASPDPAGALRGLREEAR